MSIRPADAAGAARPLVGVGVLILKGGRVLLGERRGSHGAGSWSPPGGHLEFGESVEDCARRETFEETGLELGTVRTAPWTSDLFAAEGKHYVTLFVLADSARGEVELKEPDKCSGWRWFRWSELPEPLFLPLASLRRTGFVPEATG